ncbi:YqhR family membrane protein [Ornithinibacillus xuwenensis]|uniref:YqhR family membrane protein n=1 Tax=Ornithinibacillus xuwenensis TaxID=3144668 RepID=UPI003D068CB6
MEDKKLEQNKQEESSSFLGRSILTGFIGGIIASLLGIFMYYFNFSEVSAKSYLIRTWSKAAWTDTWLADLVSTSLIGILSIGVAIIYYGILKKIYSIWMGVVYGLVIWGIVFFILQPMFPNIPSVAEMEMKTIVSTMCLYILYGTFIGYSISFDYHDTVLKTSKEKAKDSSE